MGFKCPACKQDFGTNKPEWESHVKSAHEGAAELVVKAIRHLEDPVPPQE